MMSKVTEFSEGNAIDFNVIPFYDSLVEHVRIR